MALYNRVKVAITAGGTGNLTIGAAPSMFRSFAGAGVPDGTVVSYVIEDSTATAWEYGRGTYTAPSTFARTTVLSTNAGNTTPINAGTSAFLFIDALAEDFVSSIGVGTTPIGGGTSGRVLFNNGGNVGEAANLTYDGTNTVASAIKLKGATSGFATVKSAPTTTDYTLTLPNAVATVAGQSLTSDTNGNLSWTTETPATMTFAATSRVLGRNTAGAGTGEELTASQVLDWIGATQGQVLYRSTAGWTALATGNAGQYLRTAGTGANPAWADLPPYAVTAFAPTKAYVANDIVSNAGKLYSAKTGFTSGATFVATDWNEIGSTSSIMPYAASKAYALGDLCSYSGNIYRCILAYTTDAVPTWDAPKWIRITNATFTAGSIPFAGADGALTEDNAALFWDATNKRLGVGTKTPTLPLHVEGNSVYSRVNNIASTNAGLLAKQIDAGGLEYWGAFWVPAFDKGSLRIYAPITSGGAYEAMTVNSVGDDAFRFLSRTSESMRLTATGQLGIGAFPAATDPLLVVKSDAKINGMTVGFGSGNNFSNLVFGSGAGASFAATNVFNIAIGARALAACISDGNTAIGAEALKSLNVATAVGNLAIGQGAANLQTSGGYNTAIGTLSLKNNVSGANNICLGYNSGNQITTGSGNVVIGSAPGKDAMTNTVIIADGAGNEKARWLANGHMGIGTQTPILPLNVRVPNVTTSEVAEFSAGSNWLNFSRWGGLSSYTTANTELFTSMADTAAEDSTVLLAYYKTRNEAGERLRLRHNAAGSFIQFYAGANTAKIMCETPSYDLRFEVKNTERMRLTAAGQLSTTTGTVTALASERRVKQNIEAIDDDLAWTVARDAQLHSYEYKSTPGNTAYGPIVDELELLDPALIIPSSMPDDEVGPIRTYDNGRLTAFYHRALSQALKRIEDLEARLAKLENK